jgi:putative alpha-1,2-mannosidase
MLQDYGIKAEVTATERVAFQRYTYPQSAESRILFDIGNRSGESGAVKDAHVEIRWQYRRTSFGLNKCNYIMIYVFYFSAIILFRIFAEK